MTFEETYQTYYNELYRFGYQLTQSDSDSKDLVHNVFLKYHVFAAGKSKILNPKAWLYKVLYNDFLTQTTRNRNHKKIESEAYNNLPISFDPDDEHNNEEIKEIILDIISAMNEKEGALLLMYYNGLKYSEIAEALELNPNSIGKTLSRTIEKFIGIFKKEYHELLQ